VTDFDAALDQIVVQAGVNGTALDTAAELLAQAIEASGNTYINIGGANTITLLGTPLAFAIGRQLHRNRTGGDLNPTTIPALATQLAELGVAPGGVLLVHTSFRAVGPVAGGPDGLIAALLAAVGPAGTLVMPSWTGDDATPFDPATTPASPDLGIVAEIFRTRPGVMRSAHAFAAVGPQARAVVDTPPPLPPHAGQPVDRVHDLDGQCCCSASGMTPAPPCIWPDCWPACPTACRTSRCCRTAGRSASRTARTTIAAGASRWPTTGAPPAAARGPVGRAHARLARSRDIVRLACARLAADPLLFLHPAAAGCEECDAARASVAPGRETPPTGTDRRG
jgi:hypothetical protein